MAMGRRRRWLPVMFGVCLTEHLWRRSGPSTLRELRVEAGDTAEALCVLVGYSPLPESVFQFGLDIGISHSIGRGNTEAFKQWFVGERTLEAHTGVTN